MFLRRYHSTQPPAGAILDTRHPLAQGLRLAMHGNGQSTAYAVDAAGRAPFGTVVGAIAPQLDTHNDKGGLLWSFNGTNQAVTWQPLRLIGPRLTVVASYVIRTSAATWYRLASCSTSGAIDWTLNVAGGGNDNQLESSLVGAEGHTWGTIYSGAGAGATWHNTPNGTNPIARHAAMTWDGTTLRQFGDGVQRNTATSAGGSFTDSAPRITSGAEIAIGRVLVTAYGGDMLVSHVHIWDRALSPAEISDHYRAPFSMFAMPTGMGMGVYGGAAQSVARSSFINC